MSDFGVLERGLQEIETFSLPIGHLRLKMDIGLLNGSRKAHLRN